MNKDHQTWVHYKEKIDAFKEVSLFNEREIWWCSTGVNIGHEQDGKGMYFSRPVLIVKRFNQSICWVLPLTSSQKEKPYQLHIFFNKRANQIILSQLRLMDQKRLQRRIGKISIFQFAEIKKALIEILHSEDSL